MKTHPGIVHNLQDILRHEGECQNERCEHYEADEVYFKPIFHLRKVGGGEL